MQEYHVTMLLLMPLVLFISCGLLLACVQTTTGYTDPTLTPPVIEDEFGNVADENDVITWTRKLPAGKPYLSASEINRNDINSEFYDLVDGFTYVVQPTDPPYGLLTALLQAQLDVSAEIMTLVKFGNGIATCFAAGILFLIIMPLVGGWFCCCRLCGKCGGKLGSRSSSNSSCWCTVHTLMIFLISIIMVAGCGLFFRSGIDTKNGAEKAISTSKINIRDVKTFVDNMAEEIRFLAVDGYNFTAEVLKRDLDNVDYLVGLQVRKRLDDLVHIERNFETIISLVDDVSLILEQERTINRSTYAIRDIGSDLQTDLDAIRARLEEVNNSEGCGKTCQSFISENSASINMKVDYNQIPSLETNITAMEMVQAADLRKLTLEDKRDFEEIPERIKNETKDQVEDIKNSVDGFTTDINNALGSITALAESTGPLLDDITEYIEQANEDFSQYKDYIIYVCYGVVGMVALITLLQVLGACGAMCYYDADVEPPDRSRASHQMGNLLMAATGLSFIFSWILMLLVCLSFLVGIILDRDVCDQLTAPDYLLLKNIIDVPDNPLGDGYILGGMLLQDASIPVTISGTLKACSQNEAAFKALQLSHVIDLNKTTDYKTLAIDSNFANMSVDFSDIVLLSTRTTEILDVYKDVTNVDYPSFINVLTTDVTETNFTILAENMRIVAKDDSTGPEEGEQLLTIADHLDMIEAENVTAARRNQSQLLEEVKAMEPLTEGKNTTIDKVKADMNESQAYLQKNIGTMFTATLQVFQDRIIGVLDSFVKRLLSGVQEDVGGCLPLYNIWLTVFEGAFCVHFVQPFNGIWFTLGWVVFFLVPSIIFSVKLSKYIRRMQYYKNAVSPVTKLRIAI